MSLTFTRRTFATRFASVLSALGIASAVLPNRASAQTPAAQGADGIRKLNSEGKTGSEKDVIMPVIIHRGLIYVAGQGARPAAPARLPRCGRRGQSAALDDAWL